MYVTSKCIELEYLIITVLLIMKIYFYLFLKFHLYIFERLSIMLNNVLKYKTYFVKMIEHK